MSGKIFGNILAYVYTIEFQKRGLPQAHMLFVLDYKNELTTPEMIDKYISAEIPSVGFELQQLVIKHICYMDHISIILHVTIKRKMNFKKVSKTISWFYRIWKKWFSYIWVILLQTVRISKKKIRQYFKSHQNFFFASSSEMNRHVYQDFVENFFFLLI